MRPEVGAHQPDHVSRIEVFNLSDPSLHREVHTGTESKTVLPLASIANGRPVEILDTHGQVSEIETSTCTIAGLLMILVTAAIHRTRRMLHPATRTRNMAHTRDRPCMATRHSTRHIHTNNNLNLVFPTISHSLGSSTAALPVTPPIRHPENPSHGHRREAGRLLEVEEGISQIFHGLLAME